MLYLEYTDQGFYKISTYYYVIDDTANKSALKIQKSLHNYLWRPKCKDLSRGIMISRSIREINNNIFIN